MMHEGKGTDMTTWKFIPISMAAALALSACGGGKEAANRLDEASNSLSNAANSVENAAAQVGNAANAVSAATSGAARYVGKYPFDKVDGHSWNDDPAILSAIKAAVPDAKIRALVLEAEGPSSPIAQKDGKVLSWACQAHNCGPHNWTTIVDPASGAAEICYVNEEAAPGKTRWFKGGKEEVKSDPCPKAE